VPSTTSPEEWTDLASTPAGAGIQAEAKALRSAAPVRTFVARVFGAHTDERAWRVGAKGEQLVAAQLSRLGPSWHVIHSVTLSETGTDLDHLVIGPGGVFSVNTKNHPGHRVWVRGDTFMVNGHRQTYVWASRSEGRKVALMLSAACGFEVAVRPVIAFVGVTDLVVTEQPADVRICSRRRIAEWLAAQACTLSAGQVEVIFEVARRSTTWPHHRQGVIDEQLQPATVAVGPAANGLSAGRCPAPGDLVQPSPTTVVLFISHDSTDGTILRGDPRPHTKFVSGAGFRWSAHQLLWYLPKSRALPPRGDHIESLADQLRSVGFGVSVEIKP
jgi:hypothetical protein